MTATRSLFTLMRTAAHPDFSQVGEQARRADRQPARPFRDGRAGPGRDPPAASPLQRGLLRLGQQDPQAFRQYRIRGNRPAA